MLPGQGDHPGHMPEHVTVFYECRFSLLHCQAAAQRSDYKFLFEIE